MESNLVLNPVFPSNGNLRMYNMFPYRHYASNKLGIEGMTDYIPEVAAMGYNAIWINPLQATGTMQQDHPDGTIKVSGSLYAMADDIELNPLIFPISMDLVDAHDQFLARQKQLINWTKTVRRHGMIPLFDLVLNHIGINKDGNSPLKAKLTEAGKSIGLNLLLSEINQRWPDIQGIDYYKNGSKKRGINTEPKDLDFAKIDVVFKILWEPLIIRYIEEYGFMGIRVDVLTHIPVAVQQRAYQLVQQLVQKIHGTDAIIVGELMISNPENYLSALSACSLTHCFNPYSFFWGYNKEGGYKNSSSESPFVKQNEQLAGIILSRPKHIGSLTNLVISYVDLDKSRKLQENTIYIFRMKEEYHFTLNADATDVCFGKAMIYPLFVVKDPSLLTLLDDHKNLLNEQKRLGLEFENQQTKYNEERLSLTNKSDEPEKSEIVAKKIEIEKRFQEIKQIFLKRKQEMKNSVELLETKIISVLHESAKVQELYHAQHPNVKPGGLIGVVGNHDVGTLKAKIMLDIAYNRALNNADGNQEKIKRIEETYENFKQAIIKGIKNTDDLMSHLQARFNLTEIEKKLLFLDLNLRMREKIFIQSMMCTGGWYSLAGDELGVCHKPEVFQEFAMGPYVGSSLAMRIESKDKQHDLRAFIRGINEVLKQLPSAHYEDKTTLHYAVLKNEVFGENPADILFMVLRFNANLKKYYLIAHCSEIIQRNRLEEIIRRLLTSVKTCLVIVVDKNGYIASFDVQVRNLEN